KNVVYYKRHVVKEFQENRGANCRWRNFGRVHRPVTGKNGQWTKILGPRQKLPPERLAHFLVALLDPLSDRLAQLENLTIEAELGTDRGFRLIQFRTQALGPGD